MDLNHQPSEIIHDELDHRTMVSSFFFFCNFVDVDVTWLKKCHQVISFFAQTKILCLTNCFSRRSKGPNFFYTHTHTLTPLSLSLSFTHTTTRTMSLPQANTITITKAITHTQKKNTFTSNFFRNWGQRNKNNTK